MFNQERDEPQFDWAMLGNVGEGRPNLGSTTDVTVYRLMQFTLRDTLIKDFGVAVADRVFYDAGRNAGIHFFRKLVKERSEFHLFVKEVQALLADLRIGILRLEKADLERMEFTVTVAEDLDCSGLPASDEVICTYDEGFLAGLFAAFTGREFRVKEVDCWCSGDRVCRFEARAQ